MKAIRINEYGNIDCLCYEEIDEPICPDDKVKVKIYYGSINHLDIWMRKGIKSKEINLPFVLGSDASGIVVEVGNNIKDFKCGDEIVIQPGLFCQKCKECTIGNENFCINYGILGETQEGVHAEYVVLDPINVYPKPKNINFAEAASMPLVFMTAYQMLIERAKLNECDDVLIYGGTSGIGSAAIQICKSTKARVVATVGNLDKMKYVEDMGADLVVLHNSKNWQDSLNNKKFDIIFEHIGMDTWNNSLKMLKRGGKIVTCGATTGSNVAIDLKHLFIKQQSILGSTMSNLNVFDQVMEKINKGMYKPFVDREFHAVDIKKAHKYIESRLQKGKVVIKF